MHIISKPRLREFWLQNSDAEVPLSTWYKQSKKADWKNIAETRKIFSNADSVGECTVFDIDGNKYRLITKINYKTKIVYIRFVLTHLEYDKYKLKDDCRRRKI